MGRRSVLIFLLSLLPSAAAGAAPTLSLADTLTAAASHPDVQARRQAAERHSAIDSTLGLLTANPQLILQPGVRTAPIEQRGYEGQFGFLLPLNLAGLSGARAEAARWEAVGLAAQADEASFTRMLEAGHAWIERRTAEEWLKAVEEEQRTAQELMARVERAVASELLTVIDLEEARTHAAEVSFAMLDVDGLVFERGVALARAIGRTDGPIATSGAWDGPPAPKEETLAHLPQTVQVLPALRAQELALRVAQARDAELKAAHGPQLSLGALAQREAPNASVFYATAQLTLPLFERGARDRAQVAAQIEQLAGEVETNRLDTVSAVLLVQHEVEHTQEKLSALEKQLLPAAQRLVDARERLLDAGESTIVDLLRARSELSAVRSRLVQARGEHAWARLHLWMLIDAIERGQRSEGSPR